MDLPIYNPLILHIVYLKSEFSIFSFAVKPLCFDGYDDIFFQGDFMSAFLKLSYDSFVH